MDENREADQDNEPAAMPIQAIVNAAGAIDYVAKSTQGVGVRELMRALRLSRGTASRVLHSLHHCGLLRRDEETGRYVLGAKVLELAAGHRRSLSIGEIARRHMAKLSKETAETVFLGVLDQGHVVIVERIDSTQPLRMASELGVREPAYCTALGKILLAGQSGESCAKLLDQETLEAHTPKTLRSAQEVMAQIEDARARGWALDDEEHIVGVRCVAAAAHDHDGRVVAAVSVAGPRFRVRDEDLPVIAQRVRAAAASIAHDLGYAPKIVNDPGGARLAGTNGRC